MSSKRLHLHTSVIDCKYAGKNCNLPSQTTLQCVVTFDNMFIYFFLFCYISTGKN